MTPSTETSDPLGTDSRTAVPTGTLGDRCCHARQPPQPASESPRAATAGTATRFHGKGCSLANVTTRLPRVTIAPTAVAVQSAMTAIRGTAGGSDAVAPVAKRP